MRKLKNEELKRLTTDAFHRSEKLPLVVVLDNVRSLFNVGSVFRTCDAFRVRELYLCGITGKPPDREIAKTALGATESVSWKYFSRTIEAVEELKEKGYRVLAVEQTENAVQLDELSLVEGTALAVIFGNEVKGVEQEVIDNCDGAVEIPQAGTKHSLNIAVSAGIVCWQLFSSVNLD